MSDVITLSIASWDQPVAICDQVLAVDALERGDVLLLPRLGFGLENDEQPFLSPNVSGKAKNVRLDPVSGSLRGASINDADPTPLRNMMVRYARSSRSLLRNLLPDYGSGLAQARTSFRPTEIAGRAVSWRKDDSRLHVDSFPSSPTQGSRILRVFSNINPSGQSRYWRLGEAFEGVARHYLSSLRRPAWSANHVLQSLGITKRLRTPYDHYMLQLHDRMKADSAYQTRVAQIDHAFPPGSTWIVFTDVVSHSAISGQHALEQTYHLPVDSMRDQSKSPLRILEALLERRLV